MGQSSATCRTHTHTYHSSESISHFSYAYCLSGSLGFSLSTSNTPSSPAMLGVDSLMLLTSTLLARRSPTTTTGRHDNNSLTSLHGGGILPTHVNVPHLFLLLLLRTRLITLRKVNRRGLPTPIRITAFQLRHIPDPEIKPM